MAFYRTVWFRAVCVAAAGAVLAIYYFFDPSTSAFPACPFWALTSYQCPGCGAQRALHAVLHGDFLRAWQLNPLWFIAGIYVAIALALRWQAANHPAAARASATLEGRWTAYIALVSVLGWGFARNL